MAEFLSDNPEITRASSSSSNNPELTRALQAVAQNLLSPAFQVGDKNMQPRWVWHQTVYDFANSDSFSVNVNAIWIPRTRRTIPATICPRIIVLLAISTHVNQVPSTLLTLLSILVTNMKPLRMIATLSRRRSPLSKINIFVRLCAQSIIEKNGYYPAGRLFVGYPWVLCWYARSCNAEEGTKGGMHASKWLLFFKIFN